MERYVCIHGHFYQPPRENPWLEVVEVQDSAYPYHDWNERITAECYGPNASSRLLDKDGKIRAITNNYAQMSYNFGPTLLSWMETEAPEAYRGVIEADRLSREAFGYGSAMAQAYNHMILPLANHRDKQTQIIWGVRDFRHRFGRRPEGMWLPETAVDLDSLALMAAAGLKFAVLAPHQAARIRPLGAGDDAWEDVTGGRVDPTRAYLCPLPNDQSISLFFYNGSLSQAIAFENLLANGGQLAEGLQAVFSETRDWAQLAHVATDGETYGHHFHHGDMALAYALETVARGETAKLVNYSAFLHLHPATYQVEIVENSSWSCIHGIERWRSDCGCNTGEHPEWHQKWRAPLRDAMDWLRDALAPEFEEAAGALVNDPWAARDDYIDVVLDRSDESLRAYLEAHALRRLDGGETTRLLSLLELQRHCMLMYTSCGWFFNDISGLESVQVIQYAARAIQLAEGLSLGDNLEQEYLARLEAAKSNLPDVKDGRLIYESIVKPKALDPVRVGAHFAISSLFDPDGGRSGIHSFRVDDLEQEGLQTGALRLHLGRVRLSSIITRSMGDFDFGVLHFGDQNLLCKVKVHEDSFGRQAFDQIKDMFLKADVAPVLQALDRAFGESFFTLSSLFRDGQRSIIGLITAAALEEAEEMYRDVYERHAPLLMYLSRIGAPSPAAFQSAAELVLNADLRHALEKERLDGDTIKSLLDAAARTGISLDRAGLSLVFQQAIERLAASLASAPEDYDALEALVEAGDIIDLLPFYVELWGTQNRYYHVFLDVLPAMRQKASAGDVAAQKWIERFLTLGERLGMGMS
ncbi:MAG: DUF3536 domain-containing protein [Thermoleophilia bacterium]|jgi:alpha-amylase/alpha-mannosidase (GH57 family)